MTTMLESVARALAERRRVAPYEDIDLARAALQAIREPSHDVTKTAGQRALISLDQEQLAEAFTAMIDAILAEDKA